MKLTIKEKVGSKFQEVPCDIHAMTASKLGLYEGLPYVLEFVYGDTKMYAVGSDEVKGSWTKDKVVMDIPSFQNYFMVKMLELASSILSHPREEREAIMLESEPPEVVKAYCDKAYQGSLFLTDCETTWTSTQKK